MWSTAECTEVERMIVSIDEVGRWRIEMAKQKGGSEWELIKFFSEEIGAPTRWTRLPTHVSDSTTQVGPDHAATRVLLALGTNNHFHGLENAAEHQLEPHWPTPVRLVSTTGQTGPCWWNLGTSTERTLHRSGRCSAPVRLVQARKPQIYQTSLPSSKQTQTRNSSNTGQQRTHSGIHPSKTQQESAPVTPVWPELSGWKAPAGQLPLNPTPDLPNRSTNLCDTLGIVGTPHGYSIAKIWSTKTC
jgi:hypothetical protein